VQNVLHNFVFNSTPRSFLLGLILTAVIQSSSATTSLIVPIVGAGILSIEQIFPYVLGTNIGTTITAILAALVIGTEAALSVAFAHLCFNVSGTLLLYPFRIIPITMSKKFGTIISQKRIIAPLLLIIFFFIIPLLIIFIINGGI
jgi:sodium-dependent phosphate cotransporter